MNLKPQRCSRCDRLIAAKCGVVVPGTLCRKWLCVPCVSHLKFLEEESLTKKIDRSQRDKVSPVEKKAARCLRQMGEVFQQEFVLGSFVYDFVLPERSLIIEVNSRSYHSSKKARNKDRVKDRHALDAGYLMARVVPGHRMEEQIRGYVDLARNRFFFCGVGSHLRRLPGL